MAFLNVVAKYAFAFLGGAVTFLALIAWRQAEANPPVVIHFDRDAFIAASVCGLSHALYLRIKRPGT